MPHLILAIDTSGKNGSIALARVTPGHVQVAHMQFDVQEVVALTGGAFSAQLVHEIARLLQKHGCSKKDLEAFAVASGPGSFTGLRVGLAAIKALAEALQKPIVAVSLLEAVACSGSRKQGRVLAALDAGRGDVYAGDYELDFQASTNARMHSERLLSREDFLAEAAQKTVVTPDASIAETARDAGIQVEQIDDPGAAVVARIGWRHLQSGETIRPEDLEANYIRHSDAEIFSKPR